MALGSVMEMENDSIDVVVLASGINRIPLFPGDRPGTKALVDFHGKSSLRYVLDALDAVEGLGRVCVEGPAPSIDEELASRSGRRPLERIEGGETFLDSLVRGLEHFRGSTRVLFVTADLPLLEPEAVRDFLREIDAADPDRSGMLYVSAVPKDAFSGVFARPTKPFNGYRGMPVCHGNLFVADPRLLERPGVRARIDRMYAGRKSAIASSWALGLDVALVYMLGVEVLHLIPLREMARYLSKRYGFGIVPVVVRHPGITEDVDEPDDYAFVRDRLAERRRGTAGCA